MKQIMIASACVLLLAACAPTIMTGNERSVTVGNTNNFNIAESQAAADQYCAKHNRVAVPKIYGNEHTVYECEAK